MSSLYQLTGQRLQLQNHLEEAGYDDQTIADTLSGESAEIEAKIQDYGFIIRNKTAFADSIEMEINRLTERLDVERKRVKAIEDNLLKSMLTCGFTTIEAPNFTVSVKQNPEKVDVIDVGLIPKQYMKIPEFKVPERQPDKVLIKELIHAGIEVAGCRLVRESKLVIK